MEVKPACHRAWSQLDFCSGVQQEQISTILWLLLTQAQGIPAHRLACLPKVNEAVGMQEPRVWIGTALP